MLLSFIERGECNNNGDDDDTLLLLIKYLFTTYYGDHTSSFLPIPSITLGIVVGIANEMVFHNYLRMKIYLI